MTIGEERRKQIFNVYSNSLELLKADGIIDIEFEDGKLYICPLCLNHFTLESTENPLTLEDAPPKSHGGRADVLTCKKCDNTCGYKLDAHLTNGLRQLDSQNFILGTKSFIVTAQNTHSSFNNPQSNLKKNERVIFQTRY